MRVKIRCDMFMSDGYADWNAACGCGEGMFAGDWLACMEWALGHQSLQHAGRAS